MIIYHLVLYKNNKFKFFGIIIFELIFMFLSVLAINSFYKEDTNLSLMFLIAMLQFINIVMYILFRLTYKEEILVFEKDSINIFITSKKARNKIVKNKLSQIFLFFIYQIPMIFLMSLIFRLPIEQMIILFINIVVSMLIFYIISLNDMIAINKYRKRYIDGIFLKAFGLGCLYLFYYPSYLGLIIVIICSALATISNIILIMKGYSEND